MCKVCKIPLTLWSVSSLQSMVQNVYIVTAISEERNVTCSPTSNELIYSCSLPNDTNVSDYTFTVYSVMGLQISMDGRCTERLGATGIGRKVIHTAHLTQPTFLVNI